MEAAVKFNDLYIKHASWKVWLQSVQQGRARQQLEQQHAARQRGIQRFLQVTRTAGLKLCSGITAANVAGLEPL